MNVASTLAVVLALHGPFDSGPSVHVTDPNLKFEIRWIGDFVGDGKVELFTNPDGTGQVIDSAGSTNSHEHTVDFTVGGVLSPDTTYYFKITHTDPTGIRADLTNDPPPLPSVFTGVQAIGEVLVQPDATSALISWDANVIGLGQVEFGTAASPTFTFLTDNLNITDHSIQLTGLSPGTTYQFWVRNLHAIEGFTLAEEIGTFTTLSAPVPEPSSLIAWAALSFAGIVGSRRQSRSQQSA